MLVRNDHSYNSNIDDTIKIITAFAPIFPALTLHNADKISSMDMHNHKIFL